jgi:3-oxoacyl-[acyl-carrier protein] reductase
VNVSSLVGVKGFPGTLVYSATKGAVDTITRVLASELGARKIRVNAVNPGVVITEGTHTAGVAGGDLEKQYIAMTALGRVGKPDDIAQVVLFLATPASGWLTGETLFATGGVR